MTLIEMTIAVFILSVALFLLAGWTSTQRAGLKQDLAMRMLADLDKALVRYRRATGSYPLSREPQSEISAVVDLLDHQKTRPILEAFPASLWCGPGMTHLVDPWGNPLRFQAGDARHSLVIANGGRPVFTSAGPDGDFGDIDASALSDNLRSDDPGPDGFRLHDTMREALADEEQTDDEEIDQ